MDKKWLVLQKMVDKQAEDEGLWFIAETASESYLQQELRKLHAEIERHLIAHAVDGKSCPFYTDYRKSCQALKKRTAELSRH